MRHARRMIWHAVAIALGIATLFLAIAVLHGLDLRFSRHGQAWQLACSDALLRLGNAPQIAIEAKQIQEVRDERARDNDAREAETRHILRQAPWRSPAYEAALIKLKELKEGEAADIKRDTRTNTVIGTPIPVGAGASDIALSPDGAKAYVSNQFADNVSVISLATVV